MFLTQHQHTATKNLETLIFSFFVASQFKPRKYLNLFLPLYIRHYGNASTKGSSTHSSFPNYLSCSHKAWFPYNRYDRLDRCERLQRSQRSQRSTMGSLEEAFPYNRQGRSDRYKIAVTGSCGAA